MLRMFQYKPSHWAPLAAAVYSFGLFAIVLSLLTPFLIRAAGYADNFDYLAIASALRTHDFSHVQPRVFWGYSYAIACVSALFRLPDELSLVIVSIASSVAAVLLCQRLWGMAVAVWFTAANFCWIKGSMLGGSDTLAVALVFAAFHEARLERWYRASLFAAMATIVRPAPGFIALLAIGATLLWRRQWRTAAACTAIGFVMAVGYMIPQYVIYHDPLMHWHSYSRFDWKAASPITLPLLPLAQGIREYLSAQPVTNIVWTAIWVLFTIATLVLMIKNGKEQRRDFPVEWGFGIGYAVFLLAYNSPHWLKAEYPRFVLPLVPLGIREFSKQAEALIPAFPLYATVSAILGAASAMNVRKAMATFHGLLR